MSSMYKEYKYCTNCNRYHTYKYRCVTPIFIYITRATRRIVDRLKFLGFKVLGTKLMSDMNYSGVDPYIIRIEIHFKLAYSEQLLAELPDGWKWEVNTTSELNPLLVYTAELEFSDSIATLIQQSSSQAIAALEKYLKSRNEEGIRTAMLLMYD